jgi:NADPH-dependent 2,4-dienoyl-CoA reductase/sulfur reductase-like enzyme
MHLVAIGGSDAGISAALRARELDPGCDVTVIVADAYPNFSICGIPYYVSGEVPNWQNLAHRTIADLEAAGTGLRDHEAAAAGFDPVTAGSQADDHKAYYPGSHRISMRFTADRGTGQLLGVQLFGHRHAEIAKRIDIAATAIFHGMTIDAVSDLDLSYTPPLGSPWDAIQIGAQAWAAHARSH